MKNFFKIVLPAFALMLAITASLAFNMEDQNKQAYQQTNGSSSDINAVPTECIDQALICTTVDNQVPCTKVISDQVTQLYGLNSTLCNVQLFKIQE